jgi:pimeloyl-ACP methyl ester carboxylesterase
VPVGAAQQEDGAETAQIVVVIERQLLEGSLAAGQVARGRGHQLLLGESESKGEQGGERGGGILTLDAGAAQRFEDDLGAPVGGPGRPRAAGRAVYDLLTRDGYRVAVVQNPTLSLEGDAAAVRRIIDAQDGPVVLAGHSYGGAVISEAGTDPNVAALVYISASAPDKDESVSTLLGTFPPDAPQPPILPPQDGFLFLDRDQFHAAFAGDLPAADAAFMADSQVPWGVDAPGGAITDPAWRSRPTWRASAASSGSSCLAAFTSSAGASLPGRMEKDRSLTAMVEP